MTNKEYTMIAETPLEDIVKRNYIEQQLFQVAPLPLTDKNFPYGFDIQICSEGRKTNFIKITPEQFRKIEEILRGA
jgi:hypothetical protein